MPVAWRLVRAKYASTAFTGEGAAKFAGRWNSRGQRVVYTSATLSLAALETLVHLVPPVTLEYVAIEVEFADELVEHIAAKELPRGWAGSPPPPASRAVGDAWLNEARTPVLAVPSAIVPSEWNYLLNPAHEAFGKINIGKPVPFAFDPRLVPGRG